MTLEDGQKVITAVFIITILNYIHVRIYVHTFVKGHFLLVCS